MKRTLLLTIFTCFVFIVRAQTTWAPAGTEWHYDYLYFDMIGYVHIEYSNDTSIAGKSCKVLKKTLHAYNHASESELTDHIGNVFTYAKDDSVFRYVNNQFYLLYDFGAKTSDTWLVDSASTVTVDSTGTTMINGQSLRWVAVTPDSGSLRGTSGKIIERMGPVEDYLIPEFLHPDAHEGGPFRCYTDSSFGNYQPDPLTACNYIVGIEKEVSGQSGIDIYPSPASDRIQLNFPDAFGTQQVDLYSLSGKKLKSLILKDQRTTIDIHDLPEGMYLLVITDEQQNQIQRKIVKSGGN